jgi:hypothetical protein
VATKGYEDTQEGFAGASSGNDSPQDLDEVRVDGRTALFWPGEKPVGDPAFGGEPWRVWATLTVDEGGDLAVSVSGEGASREELEAVYAATVVGDDRGVAPSVASPPDGFQVVGSVDALGPIVDRSFNFGDAGPPGPVGAHSALWLRGDQELSIITLPGRSVSLAAMDALGYPPNTTASLGEVNGRPLLVAEVAAPNAGMVRVYAESAWGDLVVITAFGMSEQERPLISTELQALLATVEPAEDSAWSAFKKSAD